MTLVPVPLDYGYVPPGYGQAAGPSGLPRVNFGPTQGVSTLTGVPYGAIGPGQQLTAQFPPPTTGSGPFTGPTGTRPVGALPPVGGTTNPWQMRADQRAQQAGAGAWTRGGTTASGAGQSRLGLPPGGTTGTYDYQPPGRAQRAVTSGRNLLGRAGTRLNNTSAMQFLGRHPNIARGARFTGTGLAAAALTPVAENILPGDYGVLDQFARGAGVVAPFAAIGGPKAMGVASLIGGGLNVAANAFGIDLFGGGAEEAPADPRDQLNNWLGNVNISDEAARNIREQFEMEMMFAEDADDKDAARQTALANAQQSIQTYWATEQQQQQQAQRAMAFQMAAQDYMNPYLSDMRATQNAYSNMLEGMAPDLPPEYQSIARLTASQGRAATDRMIGAYANQVASLSQTNAMEQYYADVRNMAGQQLSAGIAQNAHGGGGLNDILAQQMSMVAL